MELRLSVPDGVMFSQLRLSRDADTGAVAFDWAPILAICAASGIDAAIFQRSDESEVAGLIVAWYAVHVSRGGAPDLVAEQLIAEVSAEGEHGEVGVQRGPGTLQ